MPANHILSSDEIPMGLGMALMQNPEAMKAFSALSPEEKAKIFSMTHNIHSKEEMEDLAEQIAGHSFF